MAPIFFRIPGFRRFHGYTLVRTILLLAESASEDLLTHELCHVWQMQHEPLKATIAWFRHPYRENPYEIEARRAVAETRRT